VEESLQAAVLFLQKDPVLTGSSFGCFQNKGRYVDGAAVERPSSRKRVDLGSEELRGKTVVVSGW
jgi:hypothetical protein